MWLVAGWLIISRWVRVMASITYLLLRIWDQSLRNFLGAQMRVGWFKTKFSKLLMQPPRVKVVVAMVAIIMVDLKIRAIPLL
jgi:hypothetical protein